MLDIILGVCEVAKEREKAYIYALTVVLYMIALDQKVVLYHTGL